MTSERYSRTILSLSYYGYRYKPEEKEDTRKKVQNEEEDDEDEMAQVMTKKR